MNAHSRADTAHPHFVAIPNSSTEGVRAYREPDEPHPLQIAFLEEAKERAWTDEIRSLLSAGKTAEADARLASELAGFDGTLARLCKATADADVALEGWDDLLPILAEWEGPPVTAITLGLTNPPDLVFEPGKTVEPDLLLGLYSDEAFPFSRASKADLLAECARELPVWVGAEEDIEFHCATTGLAELNTALIHCKHRHFLRDGRDGVEGRAPGGYVEFLLANWLLATRFLQAAERAISDEVLPTDLRLIVGTVEVNSDFVTVLGSDHPSTLLLTPSNVPVQPVTATLTVKPWVRREDSDAKNPASGSTLRQRLLPAAQELEEQPRLGFLARLFGRRMRG
jgi:hypothetical protein